ncbi:MAG TPA: hypothetical protein VFV46_07450 [Lacibacter sp.]|nr:hypothetical protein [Lacibacter sp.]
MKKLFFAAVLVAFVLTSCSRGISPYQAANGKAGKCGKSYIR